MPARTAAGRADEPSGGKSELTVNGYRGWDNTFRTQLAFERGGTGISVRHFSLIPFRKEISSMIECCEQIMV